MDQVKIRNKEFAKQLVDYEGLQWGKITPTDFDGLIEYQDRGFIFFESKYKGTIFDLASGQGKAFKRLVDDLSKTKPAVLFLVWHDCASTEDIKIAHCKVVGYYFAGRWQRPKNARDLKWWCSRFIEHIKLNHYDHSPAPIRAVRDFRRGDPGRVPK